ENFSEKSEFDFKSWYEKKKPIIEDKLNLTYKEFRSQLTHFYNRNKDKYDNEYKVMVTDFLNHLIDNNDNNPTPQKPTLNYKTKYIHNNDKFNEIYQEFKLENIIQPDLFERYVIQDIMDRFSEEDMNNYNIPTSIDVELPKRSKNNISFNSLIKSRAKDIANKSIDLDQINNELNNPQVTVQW
ncbi:MAG: hypothetical protein ACOC2W_01485, partial [bacterium]